MGKKPASHDVARLDDHEKDQPTDRIYKNEYEPRLIVRASTGPAPGPKTADTMLFSKSYRLVPFQP